MKVLGLSGSLRRDAHNTRLLRAAAALLPPGAELVEFDRLREIPPLDMDELDAGYVPESVSDLKAAIAEADAVLVATPEYNHSIPGQLKNALDWASRPLATNVLRNKPVAVVGASTGAFGAVWAQAELRKVLGISGSLRRDSHNTELLRAAASLLPSGVEFELYDGLRDIPPYDEDARGEGEDPAVTFGDLEKIGVELEAIVDRTEYGLDWNAPLPKGGLALANEVTLQVDLELVAA